MEKDIEIYLRCLDYVSSKTGHDINDRVFEDATKVYLWIEQMSNNKSLIKNPSYSTLKSAMADALKRTDPLDEVHSFIHDGK